MNQPSNLRKWFSRIIYFFPLQLVFVHLKKSQQLLIFWIILFLTISGNFGQKYGIPFLLLDPEYLGKVNFMSYLILGFSFGGFVMAYNISSYVNNGFRFPFLATQSRPFLKYCINNSFIPLTFLIYYCYSVVDFKMNDLLFNKIQILYDILGFLIGYIVVILISMSYFINTNKDFLKLFGTVGDQAEDDEGIYRLASHKKHKTWFNETFNNKAWHVESYLIKPLKIKLARDFSHYNKSQLNQVFKQNNFNASIFEIVVLISIFALGLFREVDVFVIPAGASILLLFTILIMLTSAIRSWLYGWTFVAFIGLFILVNYLSKFEEFTYANKAYGLDYETESVDYNLGVISPDTISQDSLYHIQILDQWAKKNKQRTGKPKLILFNVSGGGSRASMWAFRVIQYLDSISNGESSKHMHLITGSSGGMIGAAYFRELLNLKQEGKKINLHHPKYIYDLGKDILNPIVFSLAVNDYFIRLQKFEYDGQQYWKDRGYAFEQRLNRNTRYFMDKPLGAYQLKEFKSELPLMILSPSIINDGKILLTANHPLGFMCQNESAVENQAIELGENVEYSRLLKGHQPLNIRFLSALRMSATFPYIMPTIELPTEPKIELIDAGLRDNYGVKTSIRYIYSFRDWIQKNTSGVVILQVRYGKQQAKLQTKGNNTSIYQDLTAPFGSVYGNLFNIQDYNNSSLVEYANGWTKNKIQTVDFVLNSDEEKSISLSWHLTENEREKVMQAIYLSENKKAVDKVLDLIK